MPPLPPRSRLEPVIRTIVVVYHETYSGHEQPTWYLVWGHTLIKYQPHAQTLDIPTYMIKGEAGLI
ncbi:hypothetical protein E8E14_008087 [Neopestalotiopsis sp. 37M]|nr:hypothetical protein E8E14_008087 [Neopestalotiopsis sp. 37M]